MRKEVLNYSITVFGLGVDYNDITGVTKYETRSTLEEYFGSGVRINNKLDKIVLTYILFCITGLLEERLLMMFRCIR